jgi:hypothetical protein
MKPLKCWTVAPIAPMTRWSQLSVTDIVAAGAANNTTNNNTPASQLGVYASGKGLCVITFTSLQRHFTNAG